MWRTTWPEGGNCWLDSQRPLGRQLFEKPKAYSKLWKKVLVRVWWLDSHKKHSRAERGGWIATRNKHSRVECGGWIVQERNTVGLSVVAG